MIQQHGGNLTELAELAGCGAEEILDFSISVNPFGPPERLRRAVIREWDRIDRYPEPRAATLVASAAAHLGVPTSKVLAGNGANQLLYAIPPALGMSRAVIAVPAYGDYERACRNAGMEIVTVASEEADDFIPSAERLSGAVMAGTLVFIGHPGNPAGTAMQPDAIRQLAAAHPEAVFVIDEAFADFAGMEISLLPEIPPNVIVIRSLTKFYAIPGLRVGLLIAAEKLVGEIAPWIPDWSVNAMAIVAGAAALDEDGKAFGEQTRKTVALLRERLAGQLREAGLKVYPGLANYLLVKLPSSRPDFFTRLLREHHIAIRDCSGFAGLGEGYFRVGLRDEAENDRLVEAVRAVLAVEGGAFHIPTRRTTPAIMLQGTSSDAGKSILTAAFCRIMLQDGYGVAPFKAQNMSLNSYVTPDGGEIGRAQALQAEACRLDPDVRMNPVLLKPSSDTGAQVVILGRPEQNMRAREYHTAKSRFFGRVKDAYDSLASEHEVMVLEGAGSPGEINLKDSDIVNMNMARYAASPVLLVGDIDRGGVYASFLGMYETFSRWERQLLRGFLVNKFRGDASLLTPAHDYVLECTGKPVLGVVPYLKDLRLPAEDSMSFNFVPEMKKLAQTLDVALIVADHIANFTDFTPLEMEPDINLRRVRKVEELGRPDIILLPGSKNVIGDMEKMRSLGLDRAIIDRVNGGAWLIGICGGLQFAGREIHDPWCIEGDGRSVNGLGLLPLITTLEKEKRLKLTKSVWREKNLPVGGYEIHHGVTVADDDCLVSMVDERGTPLGFAAGRVWLSYLHGVFDRDRFRRDFIDLIRVDRGMEPLREIQLVYEVEPELNRLADTVRQAVDMTAIYKIMGLR